MRQLFGTIALLILGLVLAGKAHAGAAESLVSHRAVYDLELQDASERSGIESMFGRMVYEFNGSACSGYTVGFRFVTQVDTGNAVRLTDQQTTTYENVEEKTFRFITKSYVNQKLDLEVRGSAKADGRGTSVDLTIPRRAKLELDPAQFPTAQMISLIERAKNGERFFQSHLFDGSDEGSKVMLTTSVVGSPRVATVDEQEKDATGEFANLPTWPVTIAYFDETKKDEETPVYRISFKLYENGITRDLIMDYGEFALRGTLSSLETFDGDGC
ncbi:cell envelope integrity EipB family protein [Hoeflea poritis]|uniref:Cell envelope integrity EipB family protein n=1 Tax=Hoeflea poritis TaxID=2993659 RepID=A0ABT4VIT9_9HYPH|nr:cell envelope integrity EipB family protein [Hoeflea poritis]MDA4843953.1 cell envelope integrity EipB family protein [Hoeflea poritis]